jgi:hypothetical protein
VYFKISQNMNEFSSSAPPSYNTIHNHVNDSIFAKYDISSFYAKHLNKLKEFKMVLILDDSTSMRETLNKGQTKWDELRDTCQIVVDIAMSYKIDCDALFLNRPGIRNIKSFAQLAEQFLYEPYGITPLTKCYQMSIEQNRQELRERKLLIIVFTDGCPTSDSLSQKHAIKEFKNALKHRQPMDRIFTTIVACTDDDYALRYLNKWDVEIKNLDVVDDYDSEKREIYKLRRSNDSFSFGDYIAKILLGSHVKEIDEMDEPFSCRIL